MSLRSLMSSFTIYYLSFALSLDYSSVLISIEEYWLTLGGKPSAYGVVFGSYALAQILSSPIFGYISDRRGTKFALCISIVLNAFGNALYAVAYVLESKHAVVWGRFLSGFGAGSLILGIVHITNTTTREDRGWVVANYRIAQSLAYFAGPFLGLAFIPLQVSIGNETVTTQERVLNFYTAPAWVTVLNNLCVMLPMTLFLFKNPFAPHASMRFYYKDAKQLVFHTVAIGAVLLVGNACLWGIISELFSFAFAQYHIINKQSDLWKVYIAAGMSFLAGSLMLRCLIKSKVTAFSFVIGGLVTNIVGFIFLLDFKLEAPITHTFFYVGSTLTIFGGMWFLTGTIVYYSHKITDYSNQARNRRGVFMGLINIADALGRFFGPTFLAPITYMKSRNKLDCDPTKWNPKNCELSQVNLAIPLIIIIVIGDICFFVFYHFKYGKTDMETSGSLVSNMSLSVRSQSQIQLEEVCAPNDDTISNGDI